MTAEIMGKVAFLKALQREYQYRLGTLRKSHVFYRKPYFLALQLPEETPIPCHCDACQTRLRELSQETKSPTDENEIAIKSKAKDLRAALNRAVAYPRYSALTFPFIWGPYTAVELLEIRANLIVQENSFRKMAMSEHNIILNAFLNAAVLRVAKPRYKFRNVMREVLDKNKSFSLPIDYRMAQPFDRIDASGSKSMEFSETTSLEDMGQPGTSERTERWANCFFYQRPGKQHITLMRDLTDPVGFAYKSSFDKL